MLCWFPLSKRCFQCWQMDDTERRNERRGWWIEHTDTHANNGPILKQHKNKCLWNIKSPGQPCPFSLSHYPTHKHIPTHTFSLFLTKTQLHFKLSNIHSTLAHFSLCLCFLNLLYSVSQSHG